MKNTILLVMPALIAAFFISCAESEYEKAYNKALNENTIESYEMFLQNYPDNKKYSKIARVKMDSLVLIRAYNKALNENTIESYEMFLQNYPDNKKYSKIAHVKMGSMALIKALKEFAEQRKGIPSAACSKTSDIQRIVLISENGDRYRNNLVGIMDWRASTLENLVLVGILSRDTVHAGRQLYGMTGAYSITRYYIHQYLEIYEARTGKRLYNKKFQAERVSFPSITWSDIKTKTIYGKVHPYQISDYVLSLSLGPKPRLPKPVFRRDAIRDPDGNVYTAVKIGSQEWTVENWRSTKYADGTPIPNVAEAGESGGKTGWSNLTTGAYCWNNNSTDPVEHEKWGALYNWYVVDPKNPKKIAPEGWRVPTNEDWDVLKDYLIANGGNWDGSNEGNKIGKSLASNSGGWQSHDTKGEVGNDQSSNNSSGFSALPGGCRDVDDGGFLDLGYFASFWSATEPNAIEAWAWYLYYRVSGLYHGRDHNYYQYGYSIRLVRDE